MDIQTEKPAMTQTRCFKEDAQEIRRLAEVLEAKERASFNNEHVVHRALVALSEKLAA